MRIVPFGWALATIAIAGVAVAQTSSVINACVKNDDGNMRFVVGGSCKANETLLTWNQAGPVGAVGPMGPAGATGPVGPAGAPAPSDGVITIDQAKALAGGITAGDAAGFPVTLSEPGSYRLSGNLAVPPGTHGIVFAADGVTLDLNGFSVSGPQGVYGLTDDSVARSRIVIRNGHVNGFSNSVRLIASNHVVVEDMQLAPEAAGIAAIVGASSRVHRNIVVGNGLIQLTCPGIATENITDGFISVFVLDSAKQCIRYHNRSLSYGNAISE